MTIKRATFAAGCFWGVEAAFGKVKGVKSTKVGYTGGTTKDPTYREVCSGKTGHAEAVDICYDSSILSYEELLEIFWNIHDPSTLNRQGPDIGSQYRSVIFYHDDAQKSAALSSKNALKVTEKYENKSIVTEIQPATIFYPAEEYHQKYLEKNGRASCSIW